MQTTRKHKKIYNFKALVEKHPDLKSHVFKNKYGTDTIDFSNPKAVKALNTAILFLNYNINYWQFPDKHLCPPIPSRTDYIKQLAKLLSNSGIKTDITILDIGTGATCIYPLLGFYNYGWQFIASEVDEASFDVAKTILKKNKLQAIELRLQTDTQYILKGIISDTDKLAASMCNPPFYKSEAEARAKTLKKQKNLRTLNAIAQRNFSGTASELWYKGGEKAFLHNYIYQSKIYAKQCFWFTSLVSNVSLLNGLRQALKKQEATKIEVIRCEIGNKISHILVWSFLNKMEQESW